MTAGGHFSENPDDEETLWQPLQWNILGFDYCLHLDQVGNLYYFMLIYTENVSAEVCCQDLQNYYINLEII